MNNLDLYNAFRSVPKEAQKRIGGGRLKGMTDINPMWRIKCLTEQFGPCGVGWYYTVKEKWIESAMSKDEITANVMIELFFKTESGEWSMPIVGVGGSMLVASEKNGLYVNDECYKMALTDAISVACKALGVGADIYWGSDNTKYNDAKKQSYQGEKNTRKNSAEEPTKQKSDDVITQGGADYLHGLAEETGSDTAALLSYYKVNDFNELTTKQFEHCAKILEKRLKEQGK